MVGHGSYWRKPKDLSRAWRIRVRRWRCQGCKRTTSCLPSFLLPWRHYLVWIIQSVLVKRIEAGASWADVVADCSDQELPAPRTMQRWLAAYGRRAPAWLLALLTELARQNQTNPVLAPRGPTELPPTAPPGSQLLLASLYLLAWAKGRWRELAGYGLADRLAFLAHWGHGQGLGRLV